MTEENTKSRKRWGLRILIGILLLFLLVGGLVQTRAVQDLLGQQAAHWVSKRWGHPVRIAHFHLSFFDHLSLEKVYVEDSDLDTLFFLDALQVDLNSISLRHRSFQVEQVQIRGGLLDMKRSAQDSLFNLDHFLNSLSGPANDTTSSSPSVAWVGSLNTLSLQDLQFRMEDHWEGTHIQSHLRQSTLRDLDFDLGGQCVTLDQWSLSDSEFALQTFQGAKPTSPPPPTTSGDLAYPYLGWDIHLDELLFWNNQIGFHNQEAPYSEKSPDLNHMQWLMDTLDIRAFAWTSEKFDTKLQHFHLFEEKGYRLEELAAHIGMSPQSIQIQNLKLLTPTSRFQASTRLQFEDWQTLTNNPDSILLQVDIRNSSLRLGDLYPFLPPSLDTLIGADPNERLTLASNAQGTLNQLNLASLSLQAGTAAELSLSGLLQRILHPESASGVLQQFRLQSDPVALQSWLPTVPLPTGIETLGTIEVNGVLTGSLQQIQSDSLTLFTEIGTNMATRFRVESPLDTALQFDLAVLSLQTHPDHWQAFVPDPLPGQLIRLGDLSFTGKLSGGLYQQEVSGILKTQAGSLSPNLEVQFTPDYNNADYQGNLTLNQIDLGRILDDPSQWGTLTATLSLAGTGIQPDSIDVKAKGEIAQLGAMNYNYQDLSFSGLWAQNRGSLQADLQDPNLQLELKGQADFQPNVPKFQLALQLDTVRADQLQLWPRSLSASGSLKGSWEGLNPDGMSGSVDLDSWKISNDSSTYTWEQAIIDLAADSSLRKATFSSPFLDVELAGNFSYSELPNELKNQLAPYLPGISPEPDSIQAAYPASSWKLVGTSESLHPFLSIFDPNVQRLDSLELAFSSTPNQGLTANINLPAISYQDLEIQHFSWMARESQGELLRSDLLIESLTFQDSFLHDLHWQAVAKNDTLFSDLRLGDEEVSQRLRTAGRLTDSDRKWKYEIQSPFSLNGRAWELENPSTFWLGDDWYAQNVGIFREGQSIQLQSDTSGQSIKHVLNLQGFQLEEITDLAGYETYSLSGAAEGKLAWQTQNEQPIYNGDLSLVDIILEDEPVGTLHLDVEKVARKPLLKLHSDLVGPNNRFHVDGKYHLDKEELDLQAQIDSMQMRLVDLFAGANIQESKGTISSQIQVQGPTSAPNLQGYLAFNGVSTFIDYMQSRYSLGQDTIFIRPRQVDFQSFHLNDREGRTATFTGQVHHQNFQDIRLDLGMQTDRFQLLNTTAEDNDLFYGQLFLGMDMQLTGTPESPVVKINATTQEPTDLVLITPPSSGPSVSEGGFIIYGNPEAGRDSLVGAENVYNAKNSQGIDLLMQLAVDPEAQLKVIIDPTTGDFLECRGSADITTNMDPTGNISLVGKYLLEEGRYSLNYEEVFKREFELEKGSQITFVGDPMDSRFDITAVYTTKTTYYDLLRSEMTLSDEEMRAARSRQNVDVVMRIEGDLEQPELSFDIRLPEEEEDSPLAGAIESKLTQLRAKETDLNTQVFGLLLFNNFITTSSSSSTLAGTTEALALSSVSKLITQQLNRLASRHLKGVDVNIGVDSYEAETEVADNTITEVQLGLSKKAFNDRLTIEVGGNVDLSSEQNQPQLADFTAIAGDFILNYQLDAEGKYHVQVFQKSQYDLINESNSNKTGVGFSLRKSFNRKRKRYEAIRED